jgi:hypothetical protein
MKTGAFLFLLSAVVVAGCEKEETSVNQNSTPVNTDLQNGLPQNPQKINGYFYASKEQSGSSSQVYYSSLAYATFRDPAGDLCQVFDHVTKNETFMQTKGVVFVGDVRAGDLLLDKSSLSYRTNGNPSAPIEPFWRTDGNQSFHPLNVRLQKTYPQYKNPNQTLVFSRSSGGEIVLDDIVQNADSVISLVAPFQPNFGKRVAVRPGAKIIFTPEEVTNMARSYTTILVFSCNYSHITQNGKVYLFELATPQTFYVSYVD